MTNECGMNKLWAGLGLLILASLSAGILYGVGYQQGKYDVTDQCLRVGTYRGYPFSGAQEMTCYMSSGVEIDHNSKAGKKK